LITCANFFIRYSQARKSGNIGIGHPSYFMFYA
jgi:hypothetical protein